MDTNTAIVIVAIVVAVVVVVIVRSGLWTKVSARVKTWFVTWSVDASNAPPAAQPGIKGHKLTIREGGLVAADTTGKGVDLHEVDAKKDIRITSDTPENAPKKA